MSAEQGIILFIALGVLLGLFIMAVIATYKDKYK